MIDMRRQLYAIWARLCAGSLDYIGGADPLPQPLTREEEAELLQKLPTDDGTVRSILIERNLRLVVFIARKFESSGVGLEDLISIGTIGLIKAVNTFDPEKKNKLATYASRCIENEMLMHLRHTARIRYEISLDEPLRKDWDGNELLLSDILGTESDLVYRRITGIPIWFWQISVIMVVLQTNLFRKLCFPVWNQKILRSILPFRRKSHSWKNGKRKSKQNSGQSVFLLWNSWGRAARQCWRTVRTVTVLPIIRPDVLRLGKTRWRS